MKPELWLFFGIGLLIILQGAFIQTKLKAFEDRLYDPAQDYSSNVSKSIQGVYFPGCGFYVDTRGEKAEQIENTLNHEALHMVLSQTENKSHFCHDP